MDYSSDVTSASWGMPGEVSGGFLGSSWVVPGVFLGLPRWFLGGSWVVPGWFLDGS